jgi:hypothetical protein
MLGAIFWLYDGNCRGVNSVLNFDTFVMLYRSAIALVVLVLIYATGTHRQIGTSAWRTHLINSKCVSFHRPESMVYAVTVIPLAQVLRSNSPRRSQGCCRHFFWERLTVIRITAALMRSSVFDSPFIDMNNLNPGVFWLLLLVYFLLGLLCSLNA